MEEEEEEEKSDEEKSVDARCLFHLWGLLSDCGHGSGWSGCFLVFSYDSSFPVAVA